MPDPVENATENTTAPTEGNNLAAPAAGTEASNPATDAPQEGTDTNAGDKPGDDTEPKDGKPTESEGDKPEVPESYEAFTMPEGVELDQAALERATPLLKELQLTQESAQKAVNHFATELQTGITEGVKATVENPEFLQNVMKGIDDARDAEWITALKADPDLGGAKLDETKRLALKGVDKFGSPALTKALTETRLGNHPELIRMFAKLGALVKEDGGGNPPAAGGTEVPLAKRLYPNNP